MKKTTLIVMLVLMLSGLSYAENLSDLESLAAGSYPRGLAIADIFGNRTNELIVANFGAATLIGQENAAEHPSHKDNFRLYPIGPSLRAGGQPGVGFQQFGDPASRNHR